MSHIVSVYKSSVLIPKILRESPSERFNKMKPGQPLDIEYICGGWTMDEIEDLNRCESAKVVIDVRSTNNANT